MDPPPPQQQQGGVAPAVGGAYSSKATPICGPLLRLLASMISTLASGPLREDTALLSPLLDVIRYVHSSIHTYCHQFACLIYMYTAVLLFTV